MMLETRWNFVVRYVVLFVIIVLAIKAVLSDDPCAVRDCGGESVLCLCNATYCDTITRVSPAVNQYVAYTSSRAGSRFKKSFGIFINSTDVACPLTLVLEPKITHQTIIGFGAAITDAASMNWQSLKSPQLKQYLIDSYFSGKGLEYSVLRVPIGGSDFSTHKYAYNDLPRNDVFLTNFTLTEEDYNYKIPMIKAASAVSTNKIYILGTCWSPPEWMSEPSNYTTCGRLKTKYYNTFADYYLKFIEQYEAAGVPVWGITTSNEPANGFLPLKKFNCIAWTAHHMGLWINSYLGPKIRASKYRNIKILGIEDQRQTIPLWFLELLEEHPTAIHYLDGFGIHAYSNFFSPPEQLTLITRPHPNKFILGTEACEGAYPWQDVKVELGSWERAKNYITNIITDLTYDVVGWIDWNICLNEEGGPAWNENYVDSPVIVAAQKGEFYKQPMFYAMGHFSKFLPRGSERINATSVKCGPPEKKPKFSVTKEKETVEYVAFKTPFDTVVVILYNNGNSTNVSIQVGGKQASVHVEEAAIVTMEFQL